jgi:hypothetical protein
MLTCAREPPCGPTVTGSPGFLVDRVGSAIVCGLDWVGLTIADENPEGTFPPTGPAHHSHLPDHTPVNQMTLRQKIQISSAMSVLGHVACRSQVPKFRDTHMRLTQIRLAGRSSPHGESAVRRWLYLDVNTIHNSMALVAAHACVWERQVGMWAFTCHKFAGVNVLTELAGAAGNASKEHAVPITLRPSLLSTLHF